MRNGVALSYSGVDSLHISEFQMVQVRGTVPVLYMQYLLLGGRGVESVLMDEEQGKPLSFWELGYNLFHIKNWLSISYIQTWYIMEHARLRNRFHLLHVMTKTSGLGLLCRMQLSNPYTLRRVYSVHLQTFLTLV